LLAAVALQGMDVFHKPVATRAPHLVQAMPALVGDWRMRDVPLGPNEFVTKVAEKTLNYDEVLYREYRRGAEYFTVYVAYWGAGKMPAQLVASHTPDRCWTENGWHCRDMKFHKTYFLDGRELQPAEWRLFDPPNGGNAIHLIFWHLVKGHVYDFGERFNSVPDPVRWCKNAVQQAFLGNQEQYFIRVASSLPMETLWNEPGFAEVLRGLSSLGLRAQHRNSTP
jgi:hypothetical protein